MILVYYIPNPILIIEAPTLVLRVLRLLGGPVRWAWRLLLAPEFLEQDVGFGA